MSERIIDIIVSVAEELNEDLEKKIQVEKREAAVLIGQKGVLDSIGLVNLIVAVESAVEDEFGSSLVLADERAMSQKRSPFLTIGALAQYIETLLKEDGKQ